MGFSLNSWSFEGYRLTGRGADHCGAEEQSCKYQFKVGEHRIQKEAIILDAEARDFCKETCLAKFDKATLSQPCPRLVPSGFGTWKLLCLLELQRFPLPCSLFFVNK